MKVIYSFIYFTYEYPITPKPFAEKAIFPLLNYLCAIVK